MKKFLLSMLVVGLMTTSAFASATSEYQAAKKEAEAKNFQLALDHYNNAVKQAPNFADAYLEKAVLESLMEKKDEAEKSVTKYIQLRPNDTKGYNARATLYVFEDRASEALTDLNKSLEIDPKNYETLNGRAIANFKLNNKKQAYADIEKSFEVSPNNPATYRAKALIELFDKRFIAWWLDSRTADRLEKENGTTK